MTQIDETTLARHPFRGLLHTIYYIAGPLLLVVIVWFIWSSIAQHRLATQIDAIHQPFELQDLTAPPIPDVQNAVVLWNKAFATLPGDTMNPSSSDLQYTNKPPFPAKWYEMERQSLVACANFFPEADAAAAVHSPVRGSGRLPVNSSLPNLNHARGAAGCLNDAALYSHLQGDEPQAIQRIIDLIELSQVIGRQPHFVFRLLAIGIDELSSDSICVIADGLKLNDSPNGASHDDVSRLIQMLLEDR